MDNLSRIGLCCYGLATLLELLLVIRGWRNGMFRRCPAFYLYLCLQLSPLVLGPIYLFCPSDVYAAAYWMVKPVEVMLATATIGCVMEPARERGAVGVGFLLALIGIVGGIDAWRLILTLLVFITIMLSFLPGHDGREVKGLAIALFFPALLYLPMLPFAAVLRWVPTFTFIPAQLIWWPLTGSRREQPAQS